MQPPKWHWGRWYFEIRWFGSSWMMGVSWQRFGGELEIAFYPCPMIEILIVRPPAEQ